MPVGVPYNGGQSPLEIAAIAARNVLIPKNIYNNVAAANEYTATHTRAISDLSTPVNGKGSGNYLDINNYAGVGGSYDINGVPSHAGSGRNQELSMNNSLWGYGPTMLSMTNYQQPDTTLNKGQVII